MGDFPVHVGASLSGFKLKTKNYRLDFIGGGESGMDGVWKGPAATIEEKPGSEVWGVVWELDVSDIPHLDMQEGVAGGVYRPLQITVESSSGKKLQVRSYQKIPHNQKHNPPSPQYLDVIIRGAQQNGLPPDYITKLKAIEHNGNQQRVERYERLLCQLD